MLIPLILVTALAGDIQAGPATITFSCPATRAQVVFPKLAKVLGLDLETSRQTQDEVLLMRVKDVSRSELLDRIAQVTDATWRTEGQTLRLVRSVDIERRAEKRELQDRAAIVSEQLDQAIKKLKALPAWNANEAKRLAKGAGDGVQSIAVTSGSQLTFQIQEDQGAPINRVAPLLLNEIGSKRLAEIATGTRCVYALQPTAMQLQLGGISPRLLREFVSEQRERASYSDPAPNNVSASGGSGGILNLLTLGGKPTPAPGDPDLGIGQAILVVTRNGEALQTHLVVADTSGLTLASGDYTLPEVDHPEPKLSGVTPIVLSPLAKEFAKEMQDTGIGSLFSGQTFVVSLGGTGAGNQATISLSYVGTSPSNDKLSPDLRRFLLNPESFDPQSLAPQEGILAAADATHSNLVADLPDGPLRNLTSRLYREKIGTDDLLNIVGPRSNLDIRRSGGWLTVQPTYSSMATKQQVSRVGLGRIMRSLDSQNYLRLDDLASYTMAQAKPTSEDDIDGTYLTMFNRMAAQKALPITNDPWTLRIYAELTPAERSAADSGQPIPIADLSQNQKSCLSYDVFNSEDGPNIQLPAKVREIDSSSIFLERTQSLPDGVPNNGMLTFKFQNDPAVLETSSKNGASSIVTANRVARQMMSDAKENADPNLGPKEFDGYRVATQMRYQFQFRFTPAIDFSRSLMDANVDMTGSALAFGDLPDAFKAQVNRSLIEMQKRAAGADQAGGTSIPPPN